MRNRVIELLKIKYPIIQAGMVWCSGWRLASAVSNAGGLGLIGSGSMNASLVKEHIQKCKAATSNSYGVNVPLLYPKIDEIMEVIMDEKVPIVFTSAGNPKTWTSTLKEHGITVVHVVSSVKFAVKSEESGVDAVVAEGFEAGGHNGIDETTTFCLVPAVCDAVSVPVIAAGGISTGKSMLAAMVLGAEAVQIGSRFAASQESSAHQLFKDRVVQAGEGDTKLTLKQLTPVRMIRNEFFKKVEAAEQNCASQEELAELLGRGRSRIGIFEGNLQEGELEIGQVSALIHDIKPAAKLVQEIWDEFCKHKELIGNL